MKKLIAIACLLALTTLGCGDDVDGAGLATLRAGVRVAHLSPDAPNVDVSVDGSRVLSNVPFGAVSDYLIVNQGRKSIQVTPAGATEPVVIDAVVELLSDQYYTVAATGLLADIQPLVLEDDPNGSSEARVRFVHCSPDAPAVDVAVTGGSVLFPDVAFRGSDGYLGVPPGVYDLEVRVAGTDTVALPLPGTSLPAANVTVFAIGLAGDGSLAALPVIDS